MTSAPPSPSPDSPDSLRPLALPESGWEAWLGARCTAQLDRARGLLDGLRSDETAAPRDAAVLEAWNEVHLALRNASAAASLLANVHPEEPVRSRGELAEQETQRLLTEIGLDRRLYDVLAAVDPAGLDADARRVLELSLRDFRRAGVDQPDDVRARLEELSERLTRVAQEFAKNIRDDVRRVSVTPAQLAGLPADYVEAHPPGEDGRVTLTTEYPDYVPYMTFGTDRSVRAALLAEFRNRAWPVNDALLRELLGLRREKARLLGYDGWPAYDAEEKMIGKGSAIPEFIDRIAASAEEPGRRDLAVLLDRVRADHPEVERVDGTDSQFYAEVVRRERYGVDSQEVRGYFSFAKVRQGLLDVTGRLFSVEYVEVQAPTWHEDVTAYDVHDAGSGERLGRIHLDLHPRAGKYGHAAQFDLVPGIAGRQLAEGVLVCNFSRGLMEHDHVVTLFHEFGHLLHHVLAGRHRWARFSGVATEWDFVEAPSQMLEEWAWDAQVLRTFATDAEGRPIPEDLVARMKAADDFGTGLYARTQMFYAATSYHLHQEVPEDLTARMRELQERYDLYAYVPDTHFHAAFGHLEGYGSGYYTYMWSLVIAKDLFSAFDGADLFDTAVSHRYRDAVLVPGGSRDAADLVADFLGRRYDVRAFEDWLRR